MTTLYAHLAIAQAIQERIREATSIGDAAGRVVHMLAVQSKAAFVSIQLPGGLPVAPSWEAGCGSRWSGAEGAPDFDPEVYEKDEIVHRDGSLPPITVRLYYLGVPRSDGDRVNDRVLAAYMLALIAPRISREISHLGALSEAEARVARQLSLTNDEIAVRLCLSKATVRNHLKSIYRKLGAHSRREVIGVIEARQQAGQSSC